MDNNYSLADIGALMGGRDGGCFGGSGAWVLIILFAIIFMFGGGGLFGGNAAAERVATVGDIQRSQDFSALERQNNESVAAMYTYQNKPRRDGFGDMRPAGFYGYDDKIGDYRIEDVAYWLMLPYAEEIVKKMEK